MLMTVPIMHEIRYLHILFFPNLIHNSSNPLLTTNFSLPPFFHPRYAKLLRRWSVSSKKNVTYKRIHNNIQKVVRTNFHN